MKKEKLSFVIYPTAEEEVLINRGIAGDPDTQELDSKWHREAKLAKAFFSPKIYGNLVAKSKNQQEPVRMATHSVVTKDSGKGSNTPH